MTDQSLTIAVAKLDGWVEEYPNLPQSPTHYRKEFEDRVRVFDDSKHFSSYLTSRDAIIPVIEKQNDATKDKITASLEQELFKEDKCGLFHWIYLASAHQLSTALVKATGHYIES